jgi:eukaryotic-like serine/threonine-protein kinase
MPTLAAGATIAHYRLVEELGRGGQATAFKAEDLRLGRLVVFKVLRPELALTETALKRFEREACLCSALEHPNISGLFDVGDADGLHYIVMQYVEGQTLERVMAGHPLGTQSALSLSIQVADALAVAHAHGIVHRDVKPSNVIVTPEGQAKVLDFGLAKMIGAEMPAGVRAGLSSDTSDTQVGVPYGSLGYGSPEQASGAPVDHRTDVFSLGVVVYEMFTGQRPFRGKHAIDLLHAVIHEAARPAAQLNPKVPAGLQPILDKALAKKPADRFPTMAAMRDELRALQRRLERAAAGGGPTRWSREVVRRPRTYFAVGERLGRVFGRLRLPAGAREAEALPTGGASEARPLAWGGESGKTLAVLPFRNLSGDPQAAFYEFALADALITELGQVRGLVVRPSAAVSLYAGRHWDPRQVGEELAVSSVLAGGFLRTPDQFRVTAQLLDTATGQILWSEKIDVAGHDLLTVQDAITERLVEALRLTLTPEEQERIERRPTDSPEAWEFYLRGRDLLFRYSVKTYDEGDLEAAIKAFHEAVALDAGFAAAHAALGRCYVHQTQGWAEPQSYYLAERSLRAALELDPRLVEARLFLVHVDLNQGDKERARTIVADLLRQAPNDPDVLFVAGMLHRLDGLYEKALAVYDRLLAVNPRDVVIVGFNRARIRSYQQRYEEALAELEKARSVEPDHPLAKTFLAHVLFNLGRLDEAQELMEDVLRKHPALDGVHPVLAWCLSARGEHERARALVTDRVRAAADADPDVAFWLASLYALEDLPDEALAWLRRAVRLGNENYPLFAVSAKLVRLRGDPRFVELLEELRRGWEARR